MFRIFLLEIEANMNINVSKKSLYMYNISSLSDDKVREKQGT